MVALLSGLLLVGRAWAVAPSVPAAAHQDDATSLIPASAVPGAHRAPATAPPPVSVPQPGLSLEPPDEIDQFREDSRAAGATGDATELACRPFAEALSLCFTWAASAGRKYVTRGDLEAWHLDLADLEARVLARAHQVLSEGRPERTAVVDMAATYWLSMEGDGLDMAGFLDPERLAATCGSDLRVAVPARDVFVAWNGGSGDLDRVLAVGVARINAASDHPVTTKVYQWDPASSQWEVWGEAQH